MQIWTFADQNRLDFLGRQEFYNALKLVTVAQSKRELTPELVKNALYGLAEGVGSGSAHINQLYNNYDLFSRLFRQYLFA